MQLELKLINQVLQEAKDLTIYDTSKRTFDGLKPSWACVDTTVDEDWMREGSSVEGTLKCVFKVDYLKDVFVRVTFYTDSYGEESRKNNVEFVTGTTKQVFIYENI